MFCISFSCLATESSKLAIDIKGTSLAELMNLKITSLSRKSQALDKAPAAVYVLTQDEIRRMGVTHIAEALRYVPGVEVVRQEANKWAISIRGFNSRSSNKLLVMIDGRSIYSPFFSGVLWEEKDVVLEDVERIEVIRGPGGTTWGANAVNGVINIITKDSRDTLGGFVTLGAGLEERSLTQARYGWRVDEQTTARVYGKFTERDDGGSVRGPVTSNLTDDGARMRQTGFRLDRQSLEQGNLTLQGDLYEGDLGPHYHGLGSPGQEHDGSNFKLDWSHSPTAGRSHELQLYYDDTNLELSGLSDRRHLWSFDYQVQQRWENHDVVAGVGYRRGSDNIDILPSPIGVELIPEQRNEELKSAFIQDDIAFLEDRLHLVLGSKYERNDYSKEEWQPSVRGSYAFEEALLWAAWSRAVRTPSRLEHDLAVGGLPAGDQLDPEQASVYELGWRQQWQNKWHLDIATYWADYEDLLTSEQLTLSNQMQGQVRGIETSLSYQARSNWLLRLNYSHAEMDLSVSPGSRAQSTDETTEGSMPQDMLQLISLWDINPRWQLNTYLRYVDELPGQDVSSYWAGDISLLWRPAQKTRLQLVGRHLGHSERYQWGSSRSTGVTAVEPDLALYLTQEF